MIFRNPFTRRKPKPPTLCTPDNLRAAGLPEGAIHRGEPETMEETIIRDMMPDKFRNAEGQGNDL